MKPTPTGKSPNAWIPLLAAAGLLLILLALGWLAGGSADIATPSKPEAQRTTVAVSAPVPADSPSANPEPEKERQPKPRVKFVKGEKKVIAPVDKRIAAAVAGRTLMPERIKALDALKAEIPGVQVEVHGPTGSPERIQVTGGFLTEAAPSPKPGATAPSASAVVDDFVSKHQAAFGHESPLKNTRLTREDVTAHNGMSTLVWQQELQGIPVFQSIFKANVTRDGRIVAMNSYLLSGPELQLSVDAAKLDAAGAIKAAMDAVEANVDAASLKPEGAPQGTEQKQRYVGKGISDTTVQLTYMPVEAKQVRAAYDVTIFSIEHNEMFRSVVDAETGDILYRQSLTADISNATYRVYADGTTLQPFDSPYPMTPGHSTPSSVQPPEVPRQLISLSAENTTASPNGWINDGGTETLGNNVHAHTDTNADNLPDLPRPSSATRQFDFPVNFSQSPTTYQPALVTQLFYMNNWIHDKLYALGFTESAGNFQTNNFGRGGVGNDAVQADAQDGSGTNNANFSTPADGSPGRMQMFLWTPADPDRDSDFDNEIIIHEYVHGLSNRLVGGGVGISALQSRGMGEGWSDFYAISMLSQASDGVDGSQAKGGYSTYLLSGMTTNYYFGIRRYPYGPDMSKSPLTYRDIEPGKASPHNGIPLSPRYGASNSSPDQYHAQGEVWCNMLWDVRRNLILKHGYSVGNQLALQVVTDGMKLSPANPSFLQARDGIIQADLVNNAGANLPEIWAGFAKRGMGVSASGPGSSTTIGITEAYDVPGEVTLTPSDAFSAFGILGGVVSPESTTFTLTNNGAAPLNWTASKGQSWTDLSSTAGTLSPGGSVTLTWSINSGSTGLPLGEHRDALTLTNTATGATQTRPLVLSVSSTPVAQTITFLPLAPKSHTSPPFALSATSSSGLPVTYTIVDGPATINGSTVTLTGGIGAVSIKASQAGSAVFTPAPEVVRSFIVGEPEQYAKVVTSALADSTYALKTDGTLWTWGYSPTAGSLGDDSAPGRISPAQIDGGADWLDVQAGGDHGLALKANGSLWAWGINASGQIGDGTTTTRTAPTPISPGIIWLAISAGTSHSAAIRSNGTLWTWGLGSAGQLGNGGTTNITIPTQVGSASNWTKVACGGTHTLAINAAGELWAWGLNTSGQIGDGTTVQANSPVRVGTDSNWMEIAGGSNHTLALKTNGTLWGWGSGASGQLGDGTGTSPTTPLAVGTDTDWVIITAGTFSSAARKSDGTLWAWGSNISGQLGNGSFNSSAVPQAYGEGQTWSSVSMGRYHSVALRSDGTVFVAGESNGFSGLSPRSLALASTGTSSWLQLSGASTHFVAIQSNRSLWGWGMNNNGQVGTGFTSEVRTLTQIGTTFDWQQVSAGGNTYYSNFNLAVKTTGTLWGWGFNANNNLGDGTQTTRFSPTQIGTDTNWKQASAGTSHGMAVKTNGTLWGWGSALSHQLGNGATTTRATPTQTGTDTNWSSVACGGNFSLGIKTNGTLWAWGNNSNGQLGDGSLVTSATPLQIGSVATWTNIVAGSTHTLGLRSDGSLWAWGKNSNGQLGLGDTTDRLVPTRIGTANNWVKISAAVDSTAAVNSLGEIWTCGAGHSGQHGNGQTTDLLTISRVCSDPSFGHVAMGSASLSAIRSDGSFWTAGAASPRTMGGGRDARQLSPLLPLRQQSLQPLALSYKIHQSPIRVTSNSGLPVSLRIKSGPATASGDSLALTSAGVVAFSASQFGDESAWQAIPPTLMTFTVDPTLAVTFPAPGSVGLTANGFNANGVLLNPTLGFAPSPGTLLTLVDKTGSGPIMGTLPGIPQDGYLVMSFGGVSYGFRVDYAGGDGNDIVLTQEKAPQAIQFATINPKETTDAPFALSATSTGNLPVTFSIVTGPATVVGNVLTITGAGAVTVKASQGGDGLFFPATDTLQTFAVGATDIHFQVLVTGHSASSALALKSNGDFWSWGSNTFGQLGNGNTTTVVYPALAQPTTGWTQLGAGNGVGVALKSDGTVWTWGSNASGQLGDGTTTSRITPGQATGLTNASKLATGSGHTLVIRSNGSLWGWGFNSSGQVGDGTLVNKLSPLQIGTDTDWAEVSAGPTHSAAIKADGSLWAWGINSSGQLGDGTFNNRLVAGRVGLDNDWSKVSCGNAYTLARKTDGTVWAWGFNGSGQLGIGNTVNQLTPTQMGSATDWAKLSAGSSHAVAIKTDGSLWCWGSNSSGQLGLGTTTNVSFPTRVGSATDWDTASAGITMTVLRKTDSTVWVFGHGNPIPGTSPRRLTRATASPGALWQEIDAGFNHQVGLRTDGSIWTMGNGSFGQIGNNFTFDQRTWVRVGTLNAWADIATGTAHNLAIHNNGTLWTWGNNTSGQIGDGSTSTRFVPVQVGTDNNWRFIDGGGSHSLAIKTDGTLWAWGSNFSNQLGDGTTTQRNAPVQIGSATDWASVSAGNTHSLGLKTDGSLWAWGSSTFGQIGDGTTFSRTSPIRIGTDTDWVEVAAGNSFSLARKANGSLRAWGYGGWGALGNGTTTNSSSPVTVSGTGWVRIRAAYNHCLGTQADGSLWLWGEGLYGQMMNGSTANSSTPQQISPTGGWLQAAPSGYHNILLRNDGSFWAGGNAANSRTGEAGRDFRLPAPILPPLSAQTINTTPVGTGPYRITASSGLPVQMSLVSGQATISGDEINPTGAPGAPVVVLAWQPGDELAWDAAPPTEIVIGTLNAPTLESIAHSIVTGSSANLSVTANPNAGLTTVTFHFGTDPLLANFSTTTPQAIGSGSVSTTATVPVTGLLEDTAYYYRAVVSSIGGSQTSGIQTFATLLRDISVEQPVGMELAQASNVSFGDTPLGTTTTLTFTLKNNVPGTVISLGNVTLSGPDASSFTLTTAGLPPLLSVGQTGTFTLLFRPLRLGSHTTSLSIANTDPDENPFTLSLTANGTAIPGPSQSIEGAAILPQRFVSDGPFSLAYVATSGLPLNYSVVGGTGGTITGSTFTPSSAGGAVTVRISQPGGPGYDAAPDLYRSFSVAEGTFTILAVGSQASHGVGIKADGTLWAWGRNTNSQVGNGTTTDVHAPLKIGTATTWSHAAVGSDFTLAVRSNGTLWSWGANSNGQLGHGNTTSLSVPTQVGAVTTWTHVAAGNGFSIARRSDGTLWAWGLNGSGQLGLGDTTNRTSPIQIGSATNWAGGVGGFAAGSGHVIARTTAGTLFAWGLNASNQLGLGDAANRSTPAQVGSSTTWTKLACGANSSYGLLGTALYSWGSNVNYALGDNTTINRSTPTLISSSAHVDLAAGSEHALATRTDGSLWSWGGTSGAAPQGQGDNSTRRVPTRVGNETTWTIVSAGTEHSLALRSNGTLWSAGGNDRGQLAYPDVNPVVISTGGVRSFGSGSWTSHFIKTDGSLWGVGSNVFVVGDGTTIRRPLPVQIGSATDWKELATGQAFTFALKQNGRLWAAGLNSNGQLGDGTTTAKTSFVQIGTATWSKVAAGVSHSLGIQADGSLWAWGLNTNGQLGDGTTVQKTTPVRIGSATDWVDVQCGESHSLALQANGTMWGWGANITGQVGNGTFTQQNAPVQLSGGTGWAKISAGSNFNLALRTNGSLWAWGANTNNRLGDGTTTSRSSPVQIGSATDWADINAEIDYGLALKTNGTAFGWGGTFYAQSGHTNIVSTPQIILGSTSVWSKLSAGYAVHTLIQSTDGTLWGFGSNADYQTTSAARVNSLFDYAHPGIATQTVTFPNVAIPAYNTPTTLNATASSGLPVEYFVSGPATVSGDQLTVTGPGAVKLFATQRGDRPVWHNAPITQATLTYGIADLASLTVSTGGVFPVFSPTTLGYTSTLPPGATSVSLTSTLVQPNATFTINGVPATPAVASAPIAVNIGSTVNVVVTAQNGVTSKTYQVTFNAATPFQDWAVANSVADDPEADPDSDGIPHLLEFAYGLDPSVYGVDTIGIAAGNLTHRGKPTVIANPNGPGQAALYPRLTNHIALGFTYTIHFSHDLTSWQASTTPPSVQADDGTVQACTIPFPAQLTNGHAPRFFKLQVTAP